MVVSFMGTGLSHCILATYILLSAVTEIDLSSVHWIPVFSFSMMLFIGSCGALPIPYVILSEILPDKVSITYIPLFIYVSASCIVCQMPL